MGFAEFSKPLGVFLRFVGVENDAKEGYPTKFQGKPVKNPSKTQPKPVI